MIYNIIATVYLILVDIDSTRNYKIKRFNDFKNINNVNGYD